MVSTIYPIEEEHSITIGLQQAIEKSIIFEKYLERPD
jgi:hypothetical protein